MKFLSFFFIVIFCFQNSFGIGGKDKAHFGQVVLNNEEIVEGNILFDPSSKLLFVERNEKLDTMRASDVRSFNFKLGGSIQEYNTYDMPDRNNQMVPAFFRIVWTSDDMKLLERLEVPKNADKSDDVKFLYLTNDNKRVNAYLKVEDDKKTILNRTLIQRLTRSYYRALSQYAKDHKLSFEKEKDIIKILKYYTSIKS